MGNCVCQDTPEQVEKRRQQAEKRRQQEIRDRKVRENLHKLTDNELIAKVDKARCSGDVWMSREVMDANEILNRRRYQHSQYLNKSIF